MTVRVVAAAALAAVLSLPAAAEAQARRASDGPTLRVGGLLGLDTGDFDGVGLRLDGEIDLQRLSPTLVLAGVGSVGYSRLSDDRGDVDQTLDLVTIVPAARFLIGATPELGVYVDAGLGAYWARTEADLPAPLNDDDTDLGLALRLGVGGYVRVGEGTRVAAELAVHPHFGGYDDTSVTVLVGVMFRLR